ncbi:MAG: DUF4838 domain-containing protein [Bacteroidaceae bacterium]
MKREILLLLLCFCAWTAWSQVTLVKNSNAKARIIVTGDSVDWQAAHLLQDFTHRLSGAKLPILTKKANYLPRKLDVVIGNAFSLPKELESQPSTLKEDGFLLATHHQIMYVRSGGGKGSVYAIVTLLENFFGVDYWGNHALSFVPKENLIVPSMRRVENPSFRYRQTQSYAIATDPLYKTWFRLEEPKEMFAATYWVHTFDRLLPASVYGKTHPEYYAYYNGKRHPGKATQWCLTNPELFEVVAQRIDSIFKANPGKTMISVSQNDGNFTHCRCEKCSAVEKYEGAISGNFIHFLNKLATRFPDKEFSTLAYIFTMNPPKHVKPLPNVNIMLCDIDCKREVPLTDNVSGQEFVKALEGWSAITKNIFVWDYGINFDNYLSPFPNFHVLQANMQLFKKHNATMHFSQIAGSKGGNFSELRAYLVAKLLWNTNADVDTLMHHFLAGYYGAAAPYLYRYIRTMEGALLGSTTALWIYDSPVTFKQDVLKPALMKLYNQLFDAAEEAVKGDAVLLKRVRIQRLTLQYSALELARTESVKDIEQIKRDLDLFEQRVKEYDIPTLNERSNSPVDYCSLYRERFLPSKYKSIALGKAVKYITPPTGGYANKPATTLTDGLFGGSTFVESWIGWEGIDASMVIDLETTQTIHSVISDFLHQLGQWILFPKEVTYSYSEDGIHYTLIEVHTLEEDRSVQVKFKGVRSTLATPIKARYIKIDVVATKECPTWHYGVGHPCWFFIDEVTVL